MTQRRAIVVTLAVVGLMAFGCASAPPQAKPKRKTPYLPSAETLERIAFEMLWHAEVEDSSIVKVYLFRDLICLESASRQFYAIDTATGLIRWQMELPVPLRVSPCENSKFVFAASWPWLLAIEKASGQVAWRTQIFEMPSAGLGASEESVYVPLVGRNLYGYGVSDGKRKFEFHTRANIAAPPVAENDIVYFTDEGGTVYAVLLERKESPYYKKPPEKEMLLWEKQARGGIVSAAALGEKVLVVGAKDYMIYALDKLTGATVWQTSTGSMVLTSPVCVEGIVYVAPMQAGIQAYDMAKGALLWKHDEGAGFVAAAGNANAYLLNLKDKIVALDKKTGNPLWTLAHTRYDFVLANSWTSPIILASKDGRVVAIAEQGAKLRSYVPPAASGPKPAAKKGAPKAPAPAPKEAE